MLAAEWGHGRRSGRLSNLHLGARDPASGGFVMLGKTFKGLTDEMLEWQTAEFQKARDRRDDWVVYLRPEIVVEIAFNEIQESSQYPGRPRAALRAREALSSRQAGRRGGYDRHRAEDLQCAITRGRRRAGRVTHGPFRRAGEGQMYR